MQNILIKVANFFIDNISNLLNLVLMLLPDSPFSNLDFSVFAPFIGLINWFIPINQMVIFLATWGTAVMIYYIYSVAMRFVNAID